MSGDRSGLLVIRSKMIREAAAIQQAKVFESWLFSTSLSFYAIFYTDISAIEQRFTCSEMSSAFCC
jgi:hypothetical protein